MARLFSNLIIVLVLFSFGKCDFYQEPDDETSSPETTHLEVTGLNEKQVNQIAETLGFFAKTILESTEKRKKKNAMKKSRFGQKGARLGQKSPRLWGRIGLQRPQDTESLNIENVATSDPPRATPDFRDRADSTLTRIMGMIPTEIRNVETKIAESNRKKLVLALSNFAGMVFGALIAVVKEMRLQNDFKKIQEKWKEDLGFGTDDDWNFNKWNEGNTIQFFSQLSYGYGYWGRYAIEMDESKVQCGPLDFASVLDQYSRVVKYKKGSFDPIIGEHLTNELNSKIQEQLYCLIANPTYPKNEVESELDTYVKTYTSLLAWIIKNLEKAPVT